MSRLVTALGDGDSGNVTSVTPLIAAQPIANNDYIINIVHTRNNSETITETTSLSHVSISNNSSASRGTSRVFAKITNGTETNPTFGIAGASSDVSWATIIFRGLANTSETDTVVASTSGSPPSGFDDDYTFPTVDTTGHNNCVILYIITTEERSRKWFFFPNVKQELNIDNNSSGGTSSGISVAWYVQQTGGTTASNVRAITSGAGIDYTVHVIALKNDGNNAIKGFCDPAQMPATLIHPLFYTSSNFYAGDLNDSSERTNDPSTIISKLDDPSTGVATVSQAYNTISATGFTDSNTDNPSYGGFNSTSSGHWDDVNIRGTKLASNQDLSSSILCVQLFANDGDVYKWSDDGAYWVGLLNGDLTNGAAKTFRLAAKDTVVRPTNGRFPYVFDVANGVSQTHTAGTGSLDMTAVNRLAIACIPTDVNQAGFGWLYALDNFDLVGGSSTNPATLADIADHTGKMGLRTVQNQSGQATTQYYATQSITIGNGGTNTTYVDLSGQSLEFPSAYDSDTGFAHGNVASAVFELRLDAGASDTFNINSFSSNGGNFHNFVIDSGFSTSATLNLAGSLLSNYTVDLGNVGITISGAIFSSCKTITILDNDDVSGGNTFTAGNETHLVTLSTQAALSNLAGATLSESNTAIELTGNHTSLNLPANMTFTNNTYDLEYTGNTNLTLTVPSSSNLNPAKINETGSGTVTIVGSVVTVKVTVKDTSGSPIQNAQVYCEAGSTGSLPYQVAVSITRSGSTATVTHTAHGLSTSDKVKIRGANEDEYNILATITVTGANTYTYTVSGTPATPATGSPTATSVILDGTTDASGIIQDAGFSYSTDQDIEGTARKSSGTPYYTPSLISGVITSGGFNNTVFLVSDE